MALGEGETSNAGACVVEARGDTTIAGHPPKDSPIENPFPILLDSGPGWI